MAKKILIFLVIASSIFAGIWTSLDKPSPQDHVTVTPPSVSTVAPDLTAPARHVDDAEAIRALKLLKLSVPNDNIDWTKRDGTNGRYTFTNISIPKYDMTIKTMTLSGVRLIRKDMPYFDQIEIEGLHIVKETAPVSGTDYDASSDPLDQWPEEWRPQEEWDGQWDIQPNNSSTVKTELTETILDHLIARLPRNEALPDWLELQTYNQDENLTDFVRMFFESRDIPVFPDIRIEGLQHNTEEELTTLGLLTWALNPEKGNYDFQTEKAHYELSTSWGDTTYKEAISAESLNIIGIKSQVITDSFTEFQLDPSDSILFGISPFEPAFERLSVNNFKVSSNASEYDIGQIDIWHTEKENGLYSKFQRADAVRLKIVSNSDASHNEFSVDYSALLGYDTMQFSAHSQAVFNEKDRIYEMVQAQLSMYDGFIASTAFKVSDWNGYDQFSFGLSGTPASDTQNENLNAAKLHYGNMDFTDTGILDRIKSYLIDEKNINETALIETMKAPFALSTTMVKGETQSALAVSFMENLTHFLETGGRIHLRADPATPITLEEVGEIYSSPYYLNTSAEFEREITDMTEEEMNVFLSEAKKKYQKENSNKSGKILKRLNVSFDHFIAD